MASTGISGFCDQRFEPVKAAFAANFEEGLELGASLAMTHRGRNVVDLWAGFAARDRSRPWRHDTIVNVFSATKVMLIACVLKLVGERRIDLDVPVATYWPEFAQAGKSAVTTRQVLVHTAGLPGFSVRQSFAALREWNAIVALLARQEPWWQPGTRTCYSPATYGFILGEIIRRVSRSITSEYFEREFARPAGLDYQMRLRDRAILERVAELKFPDNPSPPFTGVAERAWFSVEGMFDNAGQVWEEWQHVSAELPSANGFGNARSMARIGAILAQNGELDGRRYLLQETVQQAITEQNYSECPILGMVRLGLGLGLHSPEFPAPAPSAFHWGGYGGSLMIMDIPTGTSFAYAPNRLVVGDKWGDDLRIQRLWLALAQVMADL